MGLAEICGFILKDFYRGSVTGRMCLTKKASEFDKRTFLNPYLEKRQKVYKIWSECRVVRYFH